MAHHDHSYKLLFSHPQMVRDLLDGFVREDWLSQLDYDSLEKVNGSYVSDDLRARADDLVWRVRWGENWIYVYLLLEFRSTVDPYMAVRILTYVGLLYQDLIRSGQLSEDARLPPVLPIVLYNGAARWHAAVKLSALVEAGPRALGVYSLQARYLLIDERRFRESERVPLRNLVAALFRLENSRTTADVKEVVGLLFEWLSGPDQVSLRRSFKTWLERVIVPRHRSEPIHRVEVLEEVPVMLSETIELWKAEFRREGLQEGRQQGLQEGLREGEARILLRQLHKRFGELPQHVSLRVQQATAEELESWGERLLDADVQSLDGLFASVDLSAP
jgi:predicted transposase YdaD